MTVRKLRLDEVEITLLAEPEDIDPSGCFDSGDPESDRILVESIRKSACSGNTWAWCYVIVGVTWKGYRGEASLGCCSYESEDEFRTYDYFSDMVDEALGELNEKIAAAAKELAELAV
jgi:hypothetical protein